VIKAVVVCPPAPFLIPGLAPNLLAAAGQVAAASRRAVAGLADVDRIVVLATSTDRGRLGPGTRLSGSVFGRSDVPPVPPVTLHGAPATPSAMAPSPAAVVAGYLLDGAGVRRPTEIVELARGDAATAAELLMALPESVGVLAMADGAAAHGSRAPLAQDDRADQVDQGLAAALAAGDPAGLAAATEPDDLLTAVGVAAAEVFRVLARLPAPQTAAVLARDTPFGVGYLVATWTYRSADP
jgi:hypothetical protein